MGTMANGEDPDEMQHNAAFHQGLHCLLRLKQFSGTEIPIFASQGYKVHFVPYTHA